MAMMAPSNSVPRPVLMVVGEKDFQMMLSHTLVAMKSEIAEPRPYPFWRSSSRQMTMMPEKKSWLMMSIALPAPRSLTSPYMPESTYATASMMVMRMPSSFCAPWKSALSSLVPMSTSIMREPWRSCMTRPEVTIGEMPSSMRVPLLEARMTRIQ